MKLRTIALGLASLALAVSSARADTITDNVAAAISADSSMPLASGIAIDLAQNLMVAQEASSYAANEPDSLTLSFASVLRAIWLEGTLFDETEITDASTLAFLQSQIAIDDRVSLTIYVNGVEYVPGEVINFGDVPIDPVPEPGTWILGLIGIDCLLLVQWWRRRLEAH
jgi:hypothetical protein